jgi:transposase-like protein
MRRTFTREFKLSLCGQVERGDVTKAAACREHSLSPSLLDRWIAKYEASGQAAFPSGEVDLENRVKELEASLGRAHLENEFLKEALGKLGIPVKRQP